MKKLSVVSMVLLSLSAAGSVFGQTAVTTAPVSFKYLNSITPLVAPRPTSNPSIPVTTTGYGSVSVLSTPTPISMPVTKSRRKAGKKRIVSAAHTLVPTMVVVGEPTSTEANSRKKPLK